MKCAIIGATGYTGLELIRILLRHSFVQLTYLTTRQKDPIPVRSLLPVLPESVKLEIRNHSFAEVAKNSEIIFVCLPHTESMAAVKEFRDAGKIVIDLSADYRLKNLKAYEKWYKTKHQYPALAKKAVYGLPEWCRREIQTADLIANPGCYPTSAILALAPLLKANLVDPKDIVIDSKSGVSGAGKKANPATQYAELDGDFYAYKVNQHQHVPEIVQGLEMIGKKKVSLNFVPHLLPITRGILTTAYLKKKKGVTEGQVCEAFQKVYAKEPFIRFLGAGKFPTLKGVNGTNYCDIGVTVDNATGRTIVISAIDNLIKGASGQAVQNMNIRCRFPEEEGLKVW